jgi:hypothetical protein
MSEARAEPTRSRYDTANPPGQHVGSDIPALIQTAVNTSSPTWNRLDTLIRTQPGIAGHRPVSKSTNNNGPGYEQTEVELTQLGTTGRRLDPLI